MYVTICGRFCLNEGGIAGCVNRMRAKSNAKLGVRIAGMLLEHALVLLQVLSGILPGGCPADAYWLEN